ncbi:SPW repeat domain-containing protein [Natronosalvus caseinilyticus]|uniref:SPW repeat domain-containing protein n=1 Tax=Natronosalvus caseinilyticus TaxID=2953747 RepID=UPI0028A8B0A0|nr:hypothetical protein [Natronosalvus caseinilyticus]
MRQSNRRAPTPLEIMADRHTESTGSHRTMERDPRDESTQIANEERRKQTPILSAIIAGLGLWIAFSGLLLDARATSTAVTNNLLVGLVIALTAGYNYYRIRHDVPLSPVVASLVAILGLWLIVAAPALGMVGALFWSTFAAGLLVVGLSGWTVYTARDARTVTGDVRSRF